jgi:hypothetical protein
MNIQDLKVKTVDKEKLIDFLQISLSENEKLSIDSFAIFEDKFGIDIDCCFWEIHNEHFNNEIQPVIEIECRIKKYNKAGSYSIRMDKADFVKTISLADYFKMSSEVSLTDFIRFNYNPRIESNQRLLMKYINQSRSVSQHSI